MGEVLVTECAWCARICIDGVYQDVGLLSLVDRWQKCDVSHGICPECKARVMATDLSPVERCLGVRP